MTRKSHEIVIIDELSKICVPNKTEETWTIQSVTNLKFQIEQIQNKCKRRVSFSKQQKIDFSFINQ